MQAKKSQYEIYSTMLDMQCKHAREIFKPILPKKPTESDLLQAAFKYAPDMRNGLNLHIFSEEHFWVRSGANAIFPESAEVLDNLMRARFQMDAAEGFSLPFQSFIISMPQGYKVDGLKIPSFLVSWFPYRQLEELIIGPFGRHAKFDKPLLVNLEDSTEDEMAISICYRDPVSPTAFARTFLSTAKIPELLQARTNEEFTKDLAVYQKLSRVEGLSDLDLHLQRIMMRLVAALGIYNMATDGDRLLPGFPGKQEPKLIGRAPASGFRSMTLANAFPPASDGSSPLAESYYRTWFFRQLRSERYYKGEFSEYSPGSRYVFVSDTVVGKQVAAHTQKFVEEKH